MSRGRKMKKKQERGSEGGLLFSTRLSLGLSYHALHSFFISTGTWPRAFDLTGVLSRDGSDLSGRGQTSLEIDITYATSSATLQRKIISLNAATIHMSEVPR